jgi:hypothetical protein
MRKSVIFLLMILSLSNIMCGFGAYDFDQDSFTKTEPVVSKLAGVYVPNDEMTLRLIGETGGYDLQDVSVALFSDGTFEMQNMPDWWNTIPPNFGESKGGVDSGRGLWNVVKQNWWWQVEFKFESGYLNSWDESASGLSRNIDISGEQPPYSLWFYVGDLDNGQVMIFEQVLESP